MTLRDEIVNLIFIDMQYSHRIGYEHTGTGITKSDVTSADIILSLLSKSGVKAVKKCPGFAIKCKLDSELCEQYGNNCDIVRELTLEECAEVLRHRVDLDHDFDRDMRLPTGERLRVKNDGK